MHPLTRVASLAVAVVLLSAVSLAPVGAVTQPPGDTVAVAETDPVANAADAADDTVVWVHPTNPEQSVVIGTDKRAALEVYDLSGARIQRLSYTGVGPPNGVDLRKSFSLGGSDVDVIGASGFGRMRFWTINPVTRMLTDVTARTITTIGTESGLCMYRNPTSGLTYAFVVSNDRVEQFELFDNGGRVDVRPAVRSWDIGTTAEGCVVDDELGYLYVSEEDVGIWKYGAAPNAPTTTAARTSVDNDLAGGHLVEDAEGLELVNQPGGTGYLIASSQGDSRFNIYERQGNNAFIRRFGVLEGALADGCSTTDGISATPLSLGSAFPFGLFICQDNGNGAPGSVGNQNFKFVRLETILGLDTAPPPTELVFAAEADTRVAQASPTTNWGTALELHADTSPVIQTYVRFGVSGLTAPVTSATLRLFAVDGTTNGPKVYATGTSWTEAGLTWNNQPTRIGGPLDDRASVPANAFVDFDVTAAFTATTNGLHSFNLAADSTDLVTFRSGETSSNQPRLLITTGTPPVDDTAPETTITSGPSGTVATSSVSFTFSSSEANSSFACSLNGAPPTTCASPQTYFPLADGSYTFAVAATDPAGNIDLSPASPFTVAAPQDLTPPETTILSGPTGTVSSTSATFTFSSSETGSSFACSLNGAGPTSCISPQAYTSLADDDYTFEVAATDQAGNTDPTPAQRSFTVDTTTPPTTTIVFRAAASSGLNTGQPNITINRPAGTLPGDVMVASIVANDDDPAFTAPTGWTVLSDDSILNALHQAVYVKTAGPAEPASYTWTLTTATTRRLTGGIASYIGVDPTNPVDVDGAQPNATASTSVTVPSVTTTVDGTHLVVLAAVNSEGLLSPPAGLAERWEAAVVLKLDTTADATASGSDGLWATAGPTGIRTASTTLAGRSIGVVVALRPSGGGPPPVDTTPPDTTITSGPIGTVSSTSATFTFSASENPSTFECRLDGATYADCTSPRTYTPLAEGEHTFTVQATDPAGNTDGSPATRTWTVNISAPPPPFTIGTFPFTEGSGMVASRLYPDVVWAHRDGGTVRNVLYAFRVVNGAMSPFPTGEQFRAISVPGAGNVDWEDIALSDDGFLYIGDIGNNARTRTDLRVYKVAEPDPYTATSATVVATYPYRYPGTNDDAESLVFLGGSLSIITKKTPPQAQVLYRFDTLTPNVTATLVRVRELAEPSGGFVTGEEKAQGATVSPDGRRLFLVTGYRTYMYEAAAGLTGNALALDIVSRPPVWSITHTANGAKDQVEGVAFLGDGSLLTLSETVGAIRFIDHGHYE